MDKPLNILVLDDMQERHDAFARRFKGENVVHVRDPFEAVKLMGETLFDAVFLDHDLAWIEHNPYPQEITGTDVANAMTKLPAEFHPGLVVVHSQNVVGGPRMRDILRDAGFSVQWEQFDASGTKNE